MKQDCKRTKGGENKFFCFKVKACRARAFTFSIKILWRVTIVQSHFDTLLRYVLSVIFCGAVVMKVMAQKTFVKRR